MNSKEHTRFLIRIKDAAQRFIRKEKFRGFVDDFLHRYDLWQSKLEECQEAAKRNPELIIWKDDEQGEPPHPGWKVEERVEYLLELVDESKPKDIGRDGTIRRQFWRPPLPPNPVELLMPTDWFFRIFRTDDNLTPDRPIDAIRDDKERLAAHAFIIAVVCDKLSGGIIGIELPEDPTDEVWDYYSMLGVYAHQEWCRGDKTRSKIEDALAEMREITKESDQVDKRQQTGGKVGDKSGGKTSGQSIDSQNKQEDIIELKPNICGIGLNINALIRKGKWLIKIKNLFKLFIHRIVLRK